MEWINALRGSSVGLDTAPLIYLIEEHPRYVLQLPAFFAAVDRGEFRIVTSVLTLTEVLVHPLRRGDFRLADEYRRILLHAKGVEMHPVSVEVSEEAARLRATHNLRTPDSIQIATSIIAGATTFLTNDAQLSAQPVPNILVLDRILGLPEIRVR